MEILASLNLAVWPHKKILVEFRIGGGGSVPFIKERCRLLLEVHLYLNKAMSFQICKK